MKARVTILHIRPDKMDEAVAIYRDSVVPAAMEQKGHRGCYLMADPHTGKGLSITLWETEADRLAGESSGYYHAQVSKFRAFYTAPPMREVYEVMVQPQKEGV